MPNKHSRYSDVIIIGAGAAGLMCAIESSKRKRSTTVLEHNNTIGKKIRISGGGRCNFTNIHASPKNYLSDNPHFMNSALSRYTPQDFCHLVNSYTISYHEKKLGQLFCDKSSQEIISMLKQECDRNHARINVDVTITRITKDDCFHLTTNLGPYSCQSLVIATGGLSIPTLGSTNFGYTIAQQFGLAVNHCRPGLVPLTFHNKDQSKFQQLAGISLDAQVSFGQTQFRENILFTHRGLSGPAILQISSYWQPGKPITINLVPDLNMADIFQKHSTEKTSLKNFLKNYLPSRLCDLLGEYFLENKPLYQYSPKELLTIAHFLNHWTVTPQGTEGYAKAEVTVGGVDCNELSSKTMESKKVPGLYFIGEVVDVTGHLGGFNFQWAWASGHAAGQFV